MECIPLLHYCKDEKRLESPLDCKEIKPVHPKEISPEYSLEGLMLRLKLQYFGHLMQRADSLWTSRSRLCPQEHCRARVWLQTILDLSLRAW